MNNTPKEIRKELENLAEPKYQKFTASLIPNIDNLIGVRIPLIRKIARRIVNEDWESYLSTAEDKYFEETMLQALVIGLLKEDIETVLIQVAKFVPKINNWSVCDSFCNGLKIVKSNRERVWEFITPYWQSKNTYEVRFAVVIMLFYYIDEQYIEQLFEVFDTIKHDDYYVKMALAWAVSLCYVNLPVQTMEYLKNNRLDDETYNKTLQKIRESLRVDQVTKELMKKMKR